MARPRNAFSFWKCHILGKTKQKIEDDLLMRQKRKEKSQ